MRTKPLYIALTLATFAFAGNNPDTRLVEAAAKPDTEAVRKLVAEPHVNVNTPQADGTTALHWAAHWDDREMADVLIRAGANPKTANAYGGTPLAEACTNSDPAMIDKLLKAGADPNAMSSEGETALMTAARTGSLESVKTLLDHGADVNAREKWLGQTALMWAVAENHPAVVEMLIARGADVNAHSAIREEKIKNKWFTANVVSAPPKGGFTPLLYAARQNSLEAAKMLVKAGADLNMADPDGTSALVMAIVNAHYDLPIYLMEHGADPNIADKFGRTALYAAVDMHTLEKSATRPDPKENDKATSLDVVKAALAHGANPNAVLKESAPGRGSLDVPDRYLGMGATPFLRAAKTGDAAVMRLLLEKGADAKAVTKDHTTAMILAAGLSWTMGITNVDEKDALEAIKICIQQGVDVNAANDKGETALHGAATSGRDEVVAFLVEKGAKLDVKDKEGRTPLDVAMGVGARAGRAHDSTAELLKKLMAAATPEKTTAQNAPPAQ
jgi:ankyrin repeat protein